MKKDKHMPPGSGKGYQPKSFNSSEPSRGSAVVNAETFFEKVLHMLENGREPYTEEEVKELAHKLEDMMKENIDKIGLSSQRRRPAGVEPRDLPRAPREDR